jgi:hypothetical protein
VALLSPALAALPGDTAGGQRDVTRIVSAALDAVKFFERLTPGADVDALLAVLSLTSPSLLNEIGDPSRVPMADRSFGPGSGWVMPLFTRRVRPSRFTPGRFGVWYASRELETAIAETMYHTTERLQETDEPAQDVEMQVLTADIGGFAAVLTRLAEPLNSELHHPTSYSTSQLVGSYLRDRGSDAVVYRSVRRNGGFCYGAFRPRSIRNCRRTGLITYSWDGTELKAGTVRYP